MKTIALALVSMLWFATGISAQATPPTAEERAARAAAREAAMNEPRPIEALNSLWLEELTWMEIRDAIRAGNTTALVLTGGVESNGPHLAAGKHNYSNQLMGEAVAQELGGALIAPLVTLEPGNVDGDVSIGSTGPMVSQETYIAWLTDIGDSLRRMGFTEVYYLGDSGGNQRGQAAAAEALTAKYQGTPTRFHHVPEFYNHTQVRQYIQEDLGQPGVGWHPRRVVDRLDHVGARPDHDSLRPAGGRRGGDNQRRESRAHRRDPGAGQEAHRVPDADHG